MPRPRALEEHSREVAREKVERLDEFCRLLRCGMTPRLAAAVVGVGSRTGERYRRELKERGLLG